ncbi:MAG: hypothetical protein ACXVEE_40605 [Polyangiales bacterium]
MRAHARAKAVIALLLAGSATAIASCSLDTFGTADSVEDSSVTFDSGELDGDLDAFDVAPETVTETGCAKEAGSGCTSSLGCFSGTVQCDGTCNAPSDPLSTGTKCKTPKGCDGKVDCDGMCQGEPLATGTACTTANGCSGKLACDMTCAGDPINFGKPCKTARGCDSKFNCVGCPELPTAGKPCTTASGCSALTACDGTCPDTPPVGTACTTTAGCASKFACDSTCKGDPKVGTACTKNTCPGTFDCALACQIPVGAKDPCLTATCMFAATKDCMGVCPDPKPGDPTKTCRTCICTTGTIDVKEDECGRCNTCAAVGCIPPTDAGTDTGSDTGSSMPDVGSDLGD